MRTDLFVALARAARFELGVAFDQLGGTSLCCGHMGQGGSCNSMCTSVNRSKTSGHVKWCVFAIRPPGLTPRSRTHDGHVSGPSRGQSSHRDSVSDPAEGVHRTAAPRPAHAAWRRRAARGGPRVSRACSRRSARHAGPTHDGIRVLTVQTRYVPRSAPRPEMPHDCSTMMPFVSGSLSFFVAMNSPVSRHVRVP